MSNQGKDEKSNNLNNAQTDAKPVQGADFQGNVNIQGGSVNLSGRGIANSANLSNVANSQVIGQAQSLVQGQVQGQVGIQGPVQGQVQGQTQSQVPPQGQGQIQGQASGNSGKKLGVVGNQAQINPSASNANINQSNQQANHLNQQANDNIPNSQANQEHRNSGTDPNNELSRSKKSSFNRSVRGSNKSSQRVNNNQMNIVNEGNQAENEQLLGKNNNELFRKGDLVKVKDEDMVIKLSDAPIWNSFPLYDRLMLKCCCGYGQSDIPLVPGGGFFIQALLNRNSVIEPKLENFFKDKCMYLKIIRSGNLEIKSSIIHPYVRVSIINLKTGRYLQKRKDGPVFTPQDKSLQVENNMDLKTHIYCDGDLGCIPPFATPPFDLRERGETFAVWNEEFVIEEDADNIWDPNNVVFFELLDFNIDLNLNEGYYEDGISRIAWGYLKLVGFSQTYTGINKIQLYEYKFKRSPEYSMNLMLNRYDGKVPDILYELDWIRKVKYQTFLEIDIRPEARPDMTFKLSRIPKYVNSVYVNEGDFSKEYFLQSNEFTKVQKNIFDSHDQSPSQKRNVLLKRLRGPKDDCKIPNKLLFKFKTAELGCLTTEFSPNGKYLACTCTNLNSLTTIKVFNVENGTIKYHFKGHQNLIHNLTWNSYNNILLSSSSDNFLSFWHIPYDDSTDVENLKYLDNENTFKIYTISFPSYVYYTEIYYDERESMILATACFDGNVRIINVTFSYDSEKDKFRVPQHEQVYVINIQTDFEKIDFYGKANKKIGSLGTMKRKIQTESEKVGTATRTVFEHRHPNCLVFDETGRLYIGDSQGTIHVWEIRMSDGSPMCRKIKTVTHWEMKGDTINKITLEPKKKRLLCVHSRDNCIRTLDINGDKAKVISRFYGIKSNKANIKSTISPCGNYVLSGSEEGRPLIWSFHSATQEKVDTFQVGFYDSVTDVCWNYKYNMVSICGFGNEYPVLVYVHEADEITEDLGEKHLRNRSEDDEYSYKRRDEEYSSETISRSMSNSNSVSRSQSLSKSEFKSNTDTSEPTLARKRDISKKK